MENHLTKKSLITQFIIIAAFVAAIVFAAIQSHGEELPSFKELDYGTIDGKVDEPVPQNFRAGLSLETFAAAASANLTENIDYGGGVGVNYFFTRGFGAGVRTLAWNTTDRFVDEIDVRLIARAPLWDRVAPYGYVEGTYNFTNSRFKDGDWGAGSGGGIELAFTKNLSAIGEAGLGVTTEGSGVVKFATGLRFNF